MINEEHSRMLLLLRKLFVIILIDGMIISPLYTIVHIRVDLEEAHHDIHEDLGYVHDDGEEDHEEYQFSWEHIMFVKDGWLKLLLIDLSFTLILLFLFLKSVHHANLELTYWMIIWDYIRVLCNQLFIYGL